MKRKPASIDEYLAGVKGERRAALDQLRKTIRSIAKDLARYEQTKGSLHFDPAAGLPATLVRKLIKTRAAED